MAYVMRGGVRIYWEETGEGSPVVLIMGLGWSSRMWHRLSPVLARQHRVILLDNRGVGASDVTRWPHTVATMADDVAEVMQAAGVDSAAVVGASMGGMIAQALALRHPERVRSLALACTWSGLGRSRWPRPASIRQLLPARAESIRDRLWSLTPLLYHPATPRERIAEDIEVLLEQRLRQRGYWNQLLGLLPFSSWAGLPSLRVPTLVVHGDGDRLIPMENGRLLASRIPGAEFRVIPQSGHIFLTDQPEHSIALLQDFLGG